MVNLYQTIKQTKSGLQNLDFTNTTIRTVLTHNVFPIRNRKLMFYLAKIVPFIALLDSHRWQVAALKNHTFQQNLARTYAGSTTKVLTVDTFIYHGYDRV